VQQPGHERLVELRHHHVRGGQGIRGLGSEHPDAAESGRLRGRDADGRVLDCERIGSLDPEKLERPQVGVGMGLRAGDVLERDHGRDGAVERCAGEDGLHLDAVGAGDDGDGHPFRGRDHRSPGLFGHRAAVGGKLEKPRQALGEQSLGIRKVLAEPDADEILVDMPYEPGEVLFASDGLALAREELGEELEVELLVLRDRAVQVEADPRAAGPPRRR
jgi:hypothetical protein